VTAWGESHCDHATYSRRPHEVILSDFSQRSNLIATGLHECMKVFKSNTMKDYKRLQK